VSSTCDRVALLGTAPHTSRSASFCQSAHQLPSFAELYQVRGGDAQ
jgi:hypothetical protein